jgi:hypothetical protein
MAETDYRPTGQRIHEHSDGIFDQVSDMGERAGTMANERRSVRVVKTHARTVD